MGAVPFGYRLVDDGRVSKNGLAVTLEPDPAEQLIVAEVRRLRDEGLGARRIAAALSAAGVVSRSGKPLVPTQVQRILS